MATTGVSLEKATLFGLLLFAATVGGCTDPEFVPTEDAYELGDNAAQK